MRGGVLIFLEQCQMRAKIDNSILSALKFPLEGNMKIDRYTKALLSVIALCLIYLCSRDLTRPPKAQADSPVRVMLVDESDHPIEGIPLR